MRPLVEFSLRRPVTILMAALAVLGLAAAAVTSLPVDFYPELSVPTILVTTSYPGSDADTVRQAITIPLEDGLASLPGVRDIKSVTRPGSAVIELGFAWGTDMVLAGVRVREAIDSRYPLLPDGAQKPRLIPANPNSRPLLTLAAIPTGGDLAFARTLAERELKTALQQISGVGSVILVGGEEQEVRVEVSENLLSARGLGIPALASTIRSEIVRVPAGTVREGALDYVVATDAEPDSLEDLAAVPIGSGGVRLGDLADVRMDTRTRKSVFFASGREAVGLVVRGSPDANPVATARAVESEIGTLVSRYGRDIQLRILDDGTRSIRAVINSLVLGLAGGALLAFLVLLVTLRNWRAALVVLASIPFSVAAALAGMAAFGIGVNTMSLGGLALGLGMIVDASVVTLERMLRKREGESDQEAVSSVAGAVFGSTLTSVIVFAPVFFLPGLLGAVYRDLAIAVVFSLLASFIVSLTVTPVLARWLGAGEKSSPVPPPRFYARVLRANLRHPWAAVLAGVLVAAAGVGTLALLPVEFSPRVRTGSLYAQFDFDENARLEWVARQGVALTGYFRDFPGVTGTFGRVGGEDEDIFYRGDPSEYSGRLSLTIRYRHTDQTAGRLEEELRAFADRWGATPHFESDTDPLEDLLHLGGTGVSYVVTADEPERARDSAQSLLDRIKAAGYSATMLESSEAEGYRFTPLRDKNLTVGTSSRDLALALRASVEGMPAGVYRSEGREYPITVALPDAIRRDPSRISDMILVADGTRTVRSGELYSIERRTAPTRYARVGRQDAVTIQVDASGSAELDDLAGDALSSRSVISQEARRVSFLLIVGSVVLYLFLGAVFESWTKPILILSTVPAALSGTVAALALGGYSLNVQSGLGLLVLMGLVVNNAILLTDAIGREARGRDVYRASLERLRPILITAGTTILALLPTALGVFGSSPQSSLAAAVAGGLSVSTIVSLFLVPALSVRNHRDT